MEHKHMTEDERPEGSKVTPPSPALMLAALVRQHGRVRVTGGELEGIATQGRLGLKPIDGGGWVLEWQESKQA